MLIGYTKLFGTGVDVFNDKTDAGAYKYRWVKNSADVIDYMFRIQPEIVYNLGKLQFGLEYMLTGVNYGKTSARMVAATDLHLVMNHRVQIMVKLNL